MYPEDQNTNEPNNAEQNQNLQDTNIKNIQSNISYDVSNIIKAINEQTEVIKGNESAREKIIDKQIQIHKRQLKIFLSASCIVILFLLVSGVYFKILIKELRKTQRENITESRYQEQVKVTIETFKEMWKWYYEAIDNDMDFRIFAKLSSTANRNDTLIYYQVLSDSERIYYESSFLAENDVDRQLFLEKRSYIINRLNDVQIIMTNQNVNRFYNYFDIIKSLDKAKMIDKSAASNVLPFFGPIGRGSNYIEMKRKKIHFRNLLEGNGDKCDCGSVLDGYEYVFKKFLNEKIAPTEYYCHRYD